MPTAAHTSAVPGAAGGHTPGCQKGTDYQRQWIRLPLRLTNPVDLIMVGRETPDAPQLYPFRIDAVGVRVHSELAMIQAMLTVTSSRLIEIV
jgi:hypothetical protein